MATRPSKLMVMSSEPPADDAGGSWQIGTGKDNGASPGDAPSPLAAAVALVGLSAVIGDGARAGRQIAGAAHRRGRSHGGPRRVRRDLLGGVGVARPGPRPRPHDRQFPG